MPTITKAANAHTAITTGYTSPTNAYADDSTYATAAPGKNAEISAYWGFPAFTTSDIPDGAVINSVKVAHQFKCSTTGSIATEYCQVFVNTTAVGSEQSNATAPAADTELAHTVTSGVALSDLRTANVLRCRSRSARGNSNTAVTFSIDYVYVTVDYTIVKTYAGSGGAQSGGSGTTTKGKSCSATGGAAAAGAAAIAKSKRYLAAGGLQSAGSSPSSFVPNAAQTWSYSSGGGMACAGTAARCRTKACTAQGGLQTSGVAPSARSKTWLSTGGLLLAGQGGLSKTKAEQGAGGVSMQGGGAVAAGKTCTALGGVLSSGSAVSLLQQQTNAWIWSGQGGMTWSGASRTDFKQKPHPAPRDQQVVQTSRRTPAPALSQPRASSRNAALGGGRTNRQMSRR